MKMKFFVRFLLVVGLVFLFAKTFFFSDQGFVKYVRLKKEISSEEIKIARLENKIKNIEINMSKFLEDDFELQKIAREDLQMGFEGEKVYLMG